MTLYFLRDTKDPEGDLKRGWSGHANAWFDNEADALVHQRHTEPLGSRFAPRQCPISGKWNADPEVGLSAFAFADERGFERAMAKMNEYACAPNRASPSFPQTPMNCKPEPMARTAS
jgi:hypothetical protein